jgi:hypothetical protein
VPATVGELAERLGRSVRYIHSICQEDGRFIVRYDAPRITDRKVIPYSQP